MVEAERAFSRDGYLPFDIGVKHPLKTDCLATLRSRWFDAQLAMPLHRLGGGTRSRGRRTAKSA